MGNDDTEVAFGRVTPVRVYFDDLDAQGILHHARFAMLLDRGLNDYWASRGYAVTDAVPADAFNVVRSLQLTYHRPVASAGDLMLWFWLNRLGRTSLEYGFQFLDPGRTTVYADGTRTNVRLGPSTMRPAPWSDAARAEAQMLLRAEAGTGKPRQTSR